MAAKPGNVLPHTPPQVQRKADSRAQRHAARQHSPKRASAVISLFIRLSNELGALANFCGQSSRVTRRGPRRELLVGSDRRTVLDGADHRRLVHAISVCHGGETLLATHAIDHALLPPIEDGMRENGEIAEHPNQIYPLK